MSNTGATGNGCDVSGLLEMLDTVTDPRGRRGQACSLSFLLAAAFVAVLAGAKNFYAVERQIKDFLRCCWRGLSGT
jgi:hypothetical protein